MPIFGLYPPRLLETVFEEIGVGLLVVARDGKVVFANRTTIEMFGITENALEKSFEDWRQMYRVEDPTGVEIPLAGSAVMRALRGEPVESEAARVQLKNGQARWIRTWAYPFAAMGLEGVMALVRDETQEVELHKTAAQLQRMETLGALAAGLTHDFNNILNTISTNVALASDPKTPREAVQARLEHISEAAAKAAELVKRLTQFSRAQELHLRALPVNDVVRDVLRLVHPLLRENVNLNVDLAGDLPPIYGDAPQLEQVFVNLIVNALDAMPDGGKLGITTQRAHARGKMSTQGKTSEFVQVSVSDTGIGIPANIQTTIFEPFFTTKTEGKGTGLGLSSAYGIVRQHNGKIEVESAPGEGATFRVLFPAVAGQSFPHRSVA